MSGDSVMNDPTTEPTWTDADAVQAVRDLIAVANQRERAYRYVSTKRLREAITGVAQVRK
jgi:hypothetical protein